MRIALLCATRRGYRVLDRLRALAPDADLVVFSFREEPHEPPFFEDIALLARACGADFHEARRVGHERWASFWSETPVDLFLCVNWRYMVPPVVYERARLGAFVFHDSLLPKYRGFSPTVWAIANGDTETGVTLFHMADGVDSGDVVAQRAIPIGAEDDISVVMERVTEAYLDTLSEALPALLRGNAPRIPQNHEMATQARRRTPEDNEIDWTRPTQEILNLIRAVTRPYPGAIATINGERLTIWRASTVPIDGGRLVGTGDGALWVICA